MPPESLRPSYALHVVAYLCLCVCQLLVNMKCLSLGSNALSRQRGGTAYQLMQMQNRSLMVVLQATLMDDKGMRAPHSYIPCA